MYSQVVESANDPDPHEIQSYTKDFANLSSHHVTSEPMTVSRLAANSGTVLSGRPIAPRVVRSLPFILLLAGSRLKLQEIRPTQPQSG